MSQTTPHDPELEKRLTEGLAQKDAQVLSELYDRYSAVLFGVVMRIVGQHEMAEDVLQESFIKIWQHGPTYDATKGRLFTWMLNVARNTAIDRTRASSFQHSKTNRELTDYVDVVDGQVSHQPKIETIGVREAVGTLNIKERELVERMYFKGMTQAEISEELGIPLGTVKTRVRAAMNNLRKLFS